MHKVEERSCPSERVPSLQDILIGAGKLTDEHTVHYSLPGQHFCSAYDS